MSTYTQIFYHIVFATKNRKPVLLNDHREDLFKYIWGIITKREGHLYRIGGTEDHIHLFTSLHPSVSLADLVKEIKVASAKWIKSSRVFPEFDHWQSGYGAFTCGIDAKDRIIDYIKNQEEHHRSEQSADEMRRLLAEASVEYEQKYFE